MQVNPSNGRVKVAMLAPPQSHIDAELTVDPLTGKVHVELWPMEAEELMWEAQQAHMKNQPKQRAPEDLEPEPVDLKEWAQQHAMDCAEAEERVAEFMAEQREEEQARAQVERAHDNVASAETQVKLIASWMEKVKARAAFVGQVRKKVCVCERKSLHSCMGTCARVS
jgi:hypothetical protein